MRSALSVTYRLHTREGEPLRGASETAMRLWILWRNTDSAYDGYDGFVVRADSEKEARLLADTFGSSAARGVWVDTDIVGCSELSGEGHSSVILAAGES
jgi:hypothetical protein